VSTKALKHLTSSDPTLATLIERIGPCKFRPRTEGTHFGAVARAIVYQQLSGKAANTIHTRFEGLYEGRAPTPAELLATAESALRGVGLSRQKIGYLRDLATQVHGGVVPIDAIHTLDDEDVIAALTQIKGVGRWTAEVFLMFRLGRLDVLPVNDLGVQKAVMLAYRLRKMPTTKKILALSEKWRPYRTIACWYLWRSLDSET
jgi:DNA-3-methyladenine glycosylase II